MGHWKAGIIVCLVLAGCSNIDSYSSEDAILIDGSSTVYPIVKSGVERYKQEHEGSPISIDYSGTSRGLLKLCTGEVDIANASRRITEQERARCKANGVTFVEVPIALDGIAFVVNAHSIWVDYLTVHELKQIWQTRSEGVVQQWSDIRSDWPDRDIRLYGPGSASGTYSYFARSVIGVPITRGDYVASEDDEMLVESISSDPNGIAFFGLGYYRGHTYSLKLVPIDDENPDNGVGPVIPSMETVKTGSYQPLSREMYMYASEEAMKTETGYDFLDYFMREAVHIVENAGYIPQPEGEYQRSRSQVMELISNSE